MPSDEPAVPTPEYPPSLLKAAEHLTAKFQEYPWFISAAPAMHQGRCCLDLYVKANRLPVGMVLPEAYEIFSVVVHRVATQPMAKRTTRRSASW